MTAQEIFDKAAVGILTQKEKSINGLTCLYRGSMGRSVQLDFVLMTLNINRRWKGTA